MRQNSWIAGTGIAIAIIASVYRSEAYPYPEGLTQFREAAIGRSSAGLTNTERILRERINLRREGMRTAGQAVLDQFFSGLRSRLIMERSA